MHCYSKSPVTHLLNLLDVLVLAFVLFYVARRMHVLDVHCLQVRTGRHVSCHSNLLHVPNRGLTAAIVSSVWSEGGGVATYRGKFRIQQTYVFTRCMACFL
jgi:hypothetical protein